MQPGARVGRYVLVAELGRGGMGVVWRAADPSGAHVALKLLRQDDGTQDRRARFLREALALARLRHPHVLRVLEAGHHEGTPFLALELVEGESLLERLIRAGQLPLPESVALTRKLCAALVHAHAHGVLHRDLKPANVLLRQDGQPVLADFGLTRDVDPVSDDVASGPLTLPGKVIGTPGYWSPEQARGDLPRIGPPSDVWGLGALLVTMLTGEPPYGHLETFGQALAAVDRPPPRPSASRREVDARLDAICARAMALEPKERHPGPAELDAELAEWEREQASGRRPDAEAPTVELAPASSSGRADLLVGGLVVGAGLFAIGLAAWFSGTGEPAAEPAPPAVVATHSPPPPPPPAPVGPQDLPRGRSSWRGSYVCNGLTTTLELTLDHDPWTRLAATFAFSPSPTAPDLPPGSFRVRGRWDPVTRRLELAPQEWIVCPGPSWVMVGLSGVVDEGATRITGGITHEGCGQFELVRAAQPPK